MGMALMAAVPVAKIAAVEKAAKGILDWVPLATAASPAEEAVIESAIMAIMLVLTALVAREKRSPRSLKLAKLAATHLSQMAKMEGVARVGPRACWEWERDAGQSVIEVANLN
jgi:hypothetical protein